MKLNKNEEMIDSNSFFFIFFLNESMIDYKNQYKN